MVEKVIQDIQRIRSELKKVNELPTSAARERFIAYIKRQIDEKSKLPTKSREYDKYRKISAILEEMRSNFVSKNISEEKEDRLVGIIYKTLSEKKLVALSSKSYKIGDTLNPITYPPTDRHFWNHLDNWIDEIRNESFQKALIAWNFSKDRREAPKRFEELQLYNLAAEAYGILDLHDDEIRLHKMMKSKMNPEELVRQKQSEAENIENYVKKLKFKKGFQSR
jgi:hypothetical protein